MRARPAMIHVKRDMRDVRMDSSGVFGACRIASRPFCVRFATCQAANRGAAADSTRQMDITRRTLRTRGTVNWFNDDKGLVLFASIASIPLRRDSTNLNPNFRLADTT